MEVKYMKEIFGTKMAFVVLFLVTTVGIVDGAINIINNPGFESGTASWSFYTNGAGAFSAASPGYEGSYTGKIVLSSIGSNMQLFQSGRTLEANTHYRLTFSAYSTTGHDVSVILIKSVSPYTNYGLSRTFNLSSSWENFTTEFNTSGFAGTVNDGRFVFRFNGIASAGDIYYIDAIVLEKVVAGGDISPPTVIGNTPTGTGVPVTAKITVTFNEPMTQASAQSAFSTSPATSGSFGWSGNMMTYTPGSSLSSGTTYTVTIGTGAKDLAGNSLQSPYSWSFTTNGGSSSIEARLAALEANMTALKAENTALKNLLANVSRNGNEIYIDGANVHIRDGSGSTEGAINGLGNLIIGYNELRGYGDNRTGSHNLVLGSRNNYTSYGGLVGGNGNDISAPYASISGGISNTASGYASSISGGSSNIASGDGSSVSGGLDNIAYGLVSSVSGGFQGNASGLESSVSGGYHGIASGQFSSVSGGNYNMAIGKESWVSGGWANTASGFESSISGGIRNTASGYYSSVSGGQNNIASGWYSSISGGHESNAKGDYSSVSGGYSNYASGLDSSISGGRYGKASGTAASISGGSSNTASSLYSSVSGGVSNTASGDDSSVSGGYGRSATGPFDWVAGSLWQDQ